ncbi:MAG: sporulation protein YabP [Firmicutes bacterium]|nr:sporulation protein YabP [Bacillota bacterium]
MEGVVNVESFDDQEVVVETDAGMLFVRGENLHIKELNLETGALQVTGTVHGLEYAGDTIAKKGKGLLGRLFR